MLNEYIHNLHISKDIIIFTIDCQEVILIEIYLTNHPETITLDCHNILCMADDMLTPTPDKFITKSNNVP